MAKSRPRRDRDLHEAELVNGSNRIRSLLVVGGAVILAGLVLVGYLWPQEDWTEERGVDSSATADLIELMSRAVVDQFDDGPRPDSDVSELINEIYVGLLDDGATVVWSEVAEVSFAEVPEPDRKVLIEAFGNSPDRSFFEDGDPAQPTSDFRRRLRMEERADNFRELVSLAALVRDDPSFGSQIATELRVLRAEPEGPSGSLQRFLYGDSAPNTQVRFFALGIENAIS